MLVFLGDWKKLTRMVDRLELCGNPYRCKKKILAWFLLYLLCEFLKIKFNTKITNIL